VKCADLDREVKKGSLREIEMVVEEAVLSAYLISLEG
jgi:hypothetical protein